jgi:hypothetical protein
MISPPPFNSQFESIEEYRAKLVKRYGELKAHLYDLILMILMISIISIGLFIII